jgi:WhiB family transcriptional regulator, redox-sensing transcriptional regulator
VREEGGMWEQAACKHVDTAMFFADPTERKIVDTAKAVCRGCELRGPCLEYAIRQDIGSGVWGGLDARERAALVTRRARRPARQRPAFR